MAMMSRRFSGGSNPWRRRKASISRVPSPGRRPPRTSNAGDSASDSTRQGPPPRTESFHSFTTDEALDVLLAEFTDRWQDGEGPHVEEYLDRLDPSRPDDLLALIYREFCLAEETGSEPTPDEFIGRFPELAERLQRLFGIHDEIDLSRLSLLDEQRITPMPEVDDQIGVYRLIRELGRGGFARVFLAEQSDLDDRLIVLKISSRVTVEPNLLARANHPNIVDVHWHRVIEDGALHILAMPFLGGATLSAILDHRRRRSAGPGTGRDLLIELDAVSAPEYAPMRSGRPARKAIEPLSYARSVAWIVAQLAEALDFAYTRGVLHGDVKPSNVLLTADGVPMLLDFNLAVEWQPCAPGRDGGEDLKEGGGTLPYMAPERLRILAADHDIDPSARVTPTERHRSDIYSLGVLLLEVLTGRSPDLGGDRRLSVSQLASVYESSRTRGGDVLIRESHRPVPAGLRSVIAHCLAPDPADRYRRASDLAEDLDRWQSDLPLIHAREPRLARGVSRWVRRLRLTTAAAAMGMAIALCVGGIAWKFSAAANAERAREKSDHFFDGMNTGAFPGRFVSFDPRSRIDAVANAQQHLKYFGALDDHDWRNRDDIRHLPPFDREELEAWLLEQSLRYARALGDRGDESDLLRGLMHMEQVVASAPYPSLLDERSRLRRKLRLPEPPAPAADGAGAPVLSPWIGEYLLGVEAELREDDAAAEEHYATVLAERPESFWGNYRASSAAASRACKAIVGGGSAGGKFSRDCIERAVKSLEVCIERRPNNADLRRLCAGLLFKVEKYQTAAIQCEKSLELAPDLPDTYRARKFLHLRLGQLDEYRAARDRYNKLIGMVSESMRSIPSLNLNKLQAESSAPGLLRQAARPPGRVIRDIPETRLSLADELSKQGLKELALSELDDALEADPDNAIVRYTRGHLLRKLAPEEADRDFAMVLRSPRFESLIKDQATRDILGASEFTVKSLLRKGNVHEAILTALEGVRHARECRYREFQANLVLALAYGAEAKDDPSSRPRVVAALREANKLSPKCSEEYQGDEFNEIRRQFGRDLSEALGLEGGRSPGS